MDKVVVTSQTMQAEGLYKISYKATFANNSYISGHVMIEQEKLEDMGMREIRKAITEDVISNLGG